MRIGNCRLRIGGALLAASALASAVAGQTASGTVTDTEGWNSPVRPLVERYVEDRGSLFRFFSAPYSPRRADRFRRFYGEWKQTLAGLDFERMPQDGKVDLLVFDNELDSQARELERRAALYAEMESLIPFGAGITDLEDARRRMEPQDGAKSAAELDRLTRLVGETREKLEKTPNGRVRKPVANRAAQATDSLRGTLRTWFAYYDGYDPVMTWWVTDPYRKLDAALAAYSAFLKERLVGIRPNDQTAIVGDPIGRSALLNELKSEMIPYSPEELMEIARKEYAWCEAEMKRAARDLGCGDDWKKAVEHVKQRHVEPGKQPELIRKLALEAIEFVEKRDLVTVPALARETWKMEMMSPERQLVSPFFTGGETISVSYPTQGMTHEQKMMSMRGNNIHFSRATVQHEVIPGHHLQGFMSQRYRPYRQVFGTPFLIEGWALYWEMRLWDLDFPRSAEDRVGMLFWRMHRCARILFSLGFHLGKMTPQECIDFLVEKVGHERENAAAEVRRSFNGTYPPLYQAAYMLGGLQLRALHGELVKGGKMTERQFHDAVLKQNAIPIEMIRAALTGQPLTRDFTPRWRFYPGT